MKYGVLVATALVCVATPAMADPVWNNISLGMTRAEVEGLYPQGHHVDYQPEAIEISDVTITEKCQAEVNIYFDDTNHVARVKVAGNPSMGGRCSNTVMTNLAAKYGQPSDWDRSGGSILAREGKVAIWRRDDGVAMRFKKFTNGILGGGGMLKASWELEFTGAAKDFAL